MKHFYRYTVLIAAICTCGVLLNVAISWGLAARFARGSNPSVQEVPGWAIAPPSAVSDQCRSTNADNWVRHGTGWSECYAERFYMDVTTGYPVMWSEDKTTIASGWPMLALRFVEYSSWQAPVDRGGEPAGLRRGILLPKWVLKLPKMNSLVRNRRLPTEPLFGFAVNTMFYAALLAVPLSVRGIRRHLRARSGRCWKCGYDMSGVTADCCPECGHARRRPTRRPCLRERQEAQ